MEKKAERRIRKRSKPKSDGVVPGAKYNWGNYSAMDKIVVAERCHSGEENPQTESDFVGRRKERSGAR